MKINTGITIDDALLAEIDKWAAEEMRSRSSMIEVILSKALKEKEIKKN